MTTGRHQNVLDKRKAAAGAGHAPAALSLRAEPQRDAGEQANAHASAWQERSRATFHPDAWSGRQSDPVGAARGLANAIMASAALWLGAAEVIRLL